MAGAICLVGGDWRMSPTPSSVDSVELTMGGVGWGLGKAT